MSVTTRTSSWYVADLIAGAVLLVRRTLGSPMAVAEPTVQEECERKIESLRGDIVKLGSSWAALCLALNTRPIDLPELLSTVGVYRLTGDRRKRAFDACVDGYTVFHDARIRRGI